MNEPIKTTYEGIEITYLEDPNKWRFTVNGRERSTESLVKARESIDRALDGVQTKKEKPWEPFEAYYGDDYGTSDKFPKVKVTSIAEYGGYGYPKVWLMRDGQRRKEPLDKLFQVTAENIAIIVDLQRIATQRAKLENEMVELKKKLVKVELPK